ncbi:hypothetical protein IFM89_001326 [Coptis chinensis]|uniref:Formamidopyrimidine-DNA glycosylase catalytic domain-containing protein n=1 Tax=Coptis chinensis TaxID=261450 RepID=A0A835LHB0_9MAGN|nr:hypothetical protein IFM89_001326 [Coptis chinensis]
MPELPEVEAARRAIQEHCLGKKIKSAHVSDDSKVIDAGRISPSDFQASLIGKTIVAAHRKGKNLWLQLDSPPFPSFQFGMAGAIYIKGVAVTKYKRSQVNDTEEWPSKYSKLFLQPASVPPISELGPDALLEPMTIDVLVQSLSKKKVAIKTLLLDQVVDALHTDSCFMINLKLWRDRNPLYCGGASENYIAGIGNWIADEVLYQARIHPLQVASSLPKESCQTLLECINKVTEKSVEVGADSSQFPDNWIFHSRDKKPGKAFVDGKRIEFITAGGRTTAYVPELQKLPKDQGVKNTSGQPKRKSSDGDEKEEVESGEENPKKNKLNNQGKTRAKDNTSTAKGKISDSDGEDNDGEEVKEGAKVIKTNQSKTKRKQQKRS